MSRVSQSVSRLLSQPTKLSFFTMSNRRPSFHNYIETGMIPNVGLEKQWRIQSWSQGRGVPKLATLSAWLLEVGASIVSTPWLNKSWPGGGGGFPGNQKKTWTRHCMEKYSQVGYFLRGHSLQPWTVTCQINQSKRVIERTRSMHQRSVRNCALYRWTAKPNWRKLYLWIR